MNKYNRFQRRPVAFDDINFKNNMYVGSVWPVRSSRTGEEYSITMTNKGFTCTCQGFFRHGRCKHIQSVYERFVDEEYPVYRAA